MLYSESLLLIGLMSDFVLYFSGQSGKKRRGGPGGLNKLCGVSPELQTIVGQATLPRTEVSMFRLRPFLSSC